MPSFGYYQNTRVAIPSNSAARPCLAEPMFGFHTKLKSIMIRARVGMNTASIQERVFTKASIFNHGGSSEPQT